MSMTAHFYCMACGLLLPHTARSPSSSTRLKCPHCQCEMELPSIPSTPTLAPHTSSPATPGDGSSSSSSIFSYGDAPEADASLHSDPDHKEGTLLSPEQSKSKKEGEEGESDEEEGSERDSSRGRRSKKGKKRHPLAPKRASNAYMLFCKEQRPLLKQRQPDLHFSNIGQILGEMWRTLPIDEKRPYEDRAADDRDRYKQQMQHYNTSAFRHSGGMDDAFNGHSTPSLMTMNSPHLQFSFPPSSASSNSASASSPFNTFPSGGRYQPYPTHGSVGGYSTMAPQLPSLMSPSSYASIKRGRLERSSMSEGEYFARLYHFQKQQQEMINEDIRRFGKQRSYTHLPLTPMPNMHGGGMSVEMGQNGVQGAGGGGGGGTQGLPPSMHLLMGGPPLYTREDSLNLNLGAEYQSGPGSVMSRPLFHHDMDSGLMDDHPDLDFGVSAGAPQRHPPPYWGTDYDTQAMQ